MDANELIAALDEEIDRLVQVKKLLFNGASFQTRRKRKRKNTMSAEGRARISAAMKKRWAQRKKAAKR
jgi:hypothetical protein